MQGRRIGKRAVSADELGPVPADASIGLIDFEEDHAAREVRVERIACEERAGFRIDPGPYVHLGFGPVLAEDKLQKSRCRHPTGRIGVVAHFKHPELDRCVNIHVDPQFRLKGVLGMLKNTIAEPVSVEIISSSGGRLRRRGPEPPGVLVT